MRIPYLSLVFSFALAATIPAGCAMADEPAPRPFPSQPQLSGVTRDEAADVLKQLEDAQEALRSGEKPSFALLSGAPSYYDAANIGPRDAFLALDWSRTFWVRQMDPGNSRWTGYRLELVPGESGETVWDVRIWRNVSGNLERVELYNRPPAPL